MTLPLTFSKRLRLLAAPLVTVAAGGLLLSCENETPTVGGQLAIGEVQIALDSLTWDGTAQTIHRGDQEMTVECPKIVFKAFYDAAVDTRSTTNLLGRISVPEYGDLHCSFVSQLMCSKSLPDSVVSEKVDSMKLILTVPRGDLTGDSLAPQQLKVYELTKSLPKDIDNTFDPTGYYEPTKPLGTRSFTLSALGMNDSLYTNLPSVAIEIPMSKEWAVKIVEDYRNDKKNSVFAWPQTFEKEYFHGIYVEPTFGRGCIANISNIDFVIFYNYKATTTSTDSDGNTTSKVETKAAYTGIFASSPIVLSSNNVTYTPSDYLKQLSDANDALITSPGGYRIDMTFPGRELVDIFKKSDTKLAVVSDLLFSVPVEEIDNEYGITPPPYLIMVRKSKLDEFLKSNSLPDNKDSFYAAYDSANHRYAFSSMRKYILNLIENGVKDEDLEFTIIPADIEFEKPQQTTNSWLSYYYGYSSSSSSSSTPIKCTPYISKPSMCKLKMDEAKTVFIYSNQQMK